MRSQFNCHIMAKVVPQRIIRKQTFKGDGLVGSILNRAVDKLPIELHIPGYQFCGPGTKLDERLAHGDQGVNKLDSYCKDHDIAYKQFKDNERRQIADQILANKSWKRFTSNDASLGERSAALAVATIMGAKSKFAGKGLQLGTGSTTKKKKKTKKTEKTKRKKKMTTMTTTKGGFLPAIPALLSGLGVLGSLIGGTASTVKAISDVNTNRKQLEETERHNKAMEGKGMYLRPYRPSTITRGNGLYLRPYPKRTTQQGDGLRSNEKNNNYDDFDEEDKRHNRTDTIVNESGPDTVC